jgi:hypothetical protein
MWKLIIHTIPPEKRQALLEYLNAAQNKDPTFHYKAEDKYIIVECHSKNIAHRRGTLLHYKFGVYYEVEYQNEPKV